MHIYTCTCSFASRQCICQGFSQILHSSLPKTCCLCQYLLSLIKAAALWAPVLTHYYYYHYYVFCFLSTIAVSVIVRCGQTTSRFECLPGGNGRKVVMNCSWGQILNWQPNTLFLEILMYMVHRALRSEVM